MSIVFAVDVSGSVQNHASYWHIVKKQYEQLCSRYPTDRSHIQYIAWSAGPAKVITEVTLKDYIARKYGGGGTCPDTFVTAMIAGNRRRFNELVLITDGEVDHSSVTRLDDTLQTKDIIIEKSNCHIISNGPSLSVTTPFTRNGVCNIITHRADPQTGQTVSNVQVSISAEDHALMQALDTIEYDTFVARYEAIAQMVALKMMGRQGDPALHCDLVKLKARLTQEHNRRANTAVGSVPQQLQEALESGDVATAQTLAESIVASYYDVNQEMSFSQKMDKLITMANNGLHRVYSLDAIQTPRMLSATTVQAAPTLDELVLANDADVAAAAAATDLWPCPVMYEEDVPVLLILQGSPVLAGIDKRQLEPIMKNPLALCFQTQVVQQLKARVGHVIGLSAYLQLVQDAESGRGGGGGGEVRDPFSNMPVVGCIPLSNHETHQQLADNGLMEMFCKGKQLGNVQMFFAALWWLVCKGTCMPHVLGSSFNDEDSRKLQDVWTRHLVYRMKKSWTSASMTGLPEMVGTKVPTSCAIWMVLASSSMKSIPSAAQRPFRTHAFVSSILAELNALNGYPLSSDMVRNNRYVLTMLRLLSWTKWEQNKSLFSGAIRALYQNYLLLSEEECGGPEGPATHPMFIFLDGPSPGRPETIFEHFGHVSTEDLTDEELYWLSTMVHPSKSAADVDVESAIQQRALSGATPLVLPPCIKMDECWSNYSVPSILQRVSAHTIHISPVTCRPLYQVAPDRTWVDEFEALYHHAPRGVSHYTRSISIHAQYGNFVVKYGKFPTESDLLRFLYTREVNTVGEPTAHLPLGITQYVKPIVSSFEKMIAEHGIQAEEFAKRFIDSMDIEKRIDMERQH